jgi:heptosyltransferase II
MQHTTQHNALVLGPAWIGDMIMTDSLCQALKAQQAKVFLTGPQHMQGLAQRLSAVDHYFAIDLPHGKLHWQRRKDWGKKLQRYTFERSIVTQMSWKSALIPFFANIKIRSGWLGELRYGLLNNTRRYSAKQYPTMLQKLVALAYEKNFPLHFEDCPRPKLIPQKIVHFDLEQNPAPILSLCPGAAYGPSKRWPSNHFAAVAKHYLSLGWQVWLFGGKNERPLADNIQKQCQNQCQNWLGKTSLAESIDLLAHSKAVLANDSGLMHIACALNIPTVALYGATAATFAPPLFGKSAALSLDLSCQPCKKRQCPLGHHNCMQNISPQWVIENIEQFITS